MPVSPSRAAAFDILLRVERDSSYASELLHSAAYHRLSTADHHLATELVMGVLRWRSRLDEEIAGASSAPLNKLDLEVLLALQLALYQLRWLDRIPQRAALHESVELVKRAGKSSARSFVNAVLRKLSAAAPQAKDLGDVCPSPAALARAQAHPLWLVERWIQEYGLAAAQKICTVNQAIPPTTTRVRLPEAESEVEAEGLTLTPGFIMSSARRLAAGDIAKTSAFQTGKIVIEDEASQLVAALVGGPSSPASPASKQQSTGKSRILDCCAAPGGKTLAIADRNPQASITAMELHPHRARLLRRLLQTPCRARQVPIVIADARRLPTATLFDRVLADVPCSGTGTVARNPEIKWRLEASHLMELQSLQMAILRSALDQLAPGGRVIYSTCSLEREENEDVVEQVLAANHSFVLLDCRAQLEPLKQAGEIVWSPISSLTRGPYLRTIPGVHPCDGFFAAVVERL